VVIATDFPIRRLCGVDPLPRASGRRHATPTAWVLDSTPSCFTARAQKLIALFFIGAYLCHADDAVG
jgi:hypothetical protein